MTLFIFECLRWLFLIFYLAVYLMIKPSLKYYLLLLYTVSLLPFVTFVLLLYMHHHSNSFFIYLHFYSVRAH